MQVGQLKPRPSERQQLGLKSMELLLSGGRLTGVLETCCPVGVCNPPLLQAPDEFGRDACITELLCRLPYVSATDITVGLGRSIRPRGQPTHWQVLRRRVLQILVHPSGE